MTKEDLINKMASDAKITKVAAKGALDSLMESVKKSLKKGENVVLTGFGSFKVVNRKARAGRNPQTGATIRIPAAKVPKFSAGKDLKAAVRGGKK